MNGKFIMGMVAGSIAGMTASLLLMDQAHPGMTARLMRNGKRMIYRYKKMMG